MKKILATLLVLSATTVLMACGEPPPPGGNGERIDGQYVPGQSMTQTMTTTRTNSGSELYSPPGGPSIPPGEEPMPK